MNLKFIFIFLSFIAHVKAQNVNYLGMFRSPVNYDFTLSGSFMELRETHFHTGVDIKPSYSGRKDFIYSVGVGYISRISVSPGGYGLAIYINHPEYGFTSVYGHLDGFSHTIGQIVAQYQQKNKSFEVDIKFLPFLLPVRYGEIIGIMGNTGYSFGEHLHFEIRDTKTNQPYNPYLFGIMPKDNISPMIQNLEIHGLNQDFHVTSRQNLALSSAVNGKIIVNEPIEVDDDRFGVSILTIDRCNRSNNKLGIYLLKMFVEDSLVYNYHFDRTSFLYNRYITGFYDYSNKIKLEETYSLCYQLPGTALPFLKSVEQGVIYFRQQEGKKVRIIVEDYFQNKTELQFTVIRKQNEGYKDVYGQFMQWIPVGGVQSFVNKNIALRFSDQSLYRSLPFKYKTSFQPFSNTVHHIHEPTEAIKSSIFLELKPDNPVVKLDPKSIIVYQDAKDKKYNCGGKIQGGTISTYIQKFGAYYVDRDTRPPAIDIIQFTTKVGKSQKFVFKIQDDLETQGNSVKSLKIKVMIDEKIQIAPYNVKSNLLEIPLKGLLAGSHDLYIESIDHSGNKKIFSSKFQINVP